MKKNGTYIDYQGFLLLENAKKIRQNSYLAIMNKSGTYIDYHV